MWLLVSVLVILVAKVYSDVESGWVVTPPPPVFINVCNATDITLYYKPGESPELENMYIILIEKDFPKYSVIKMNFYSAAIVTLITLLDNFFARIEVDKNEENTFRIYFFEPHNSISFRVQGRTLGDIPYVKNININTKEYCNKYEVGYLDKYIKGLKIRAKSSIGELEIKCGKRKTKQALTDSYGYAAAGDWPWHVALYTKYLLPEEYFLCSGTLISNYYVLTAGQCATMRSLKKPIYPQILLVHLGKVQFDKKDVETQQIEVSEVILHEKYNYDTFDHDLALLLLKNEVTPNNYIQPACLWSSTVYNRLSSQSEILGTIVGWGLNETQLRYVQVPLQSNRACIREDAGYANHLFGYDRFCANMNDANVGRTDNGGGLVIFVPDRVNEYNWLKKNKPGSWYVKGIVSISSVPLSTDNDTDTDNSTYTVFTDVAEYRDWILNHMN